MCTGKVQQQTVMQAFATTATIVATTIIKQKGRGAGLGMGMGLDVEKCTGSCFRLSVASARAYLCRSFATRFPNPSLN